MRILKMRSSQKNAEPNGNNQSIELISKSTTTQITKTLEPLKTQDSALSQSVTLASKCDEDFSATRLGFEKMPASPPPIKNRSIHDYVKISGNLSKSFHDIYKMNRVYLNKNKQSSLYFFKQNKYEKFDQYMYELEAAICAYYHFIAPEYAPTARAIYDDENKYIGIAVKNLPSFKSTLDNPLKDEDLDIPALKYCSIQDLEEIDALAKEENLDLDNIPDTQVIHSLVKRESGNKTPQRIKITAKDLRNFRTVKGLGIGLTISYAFEEDDNHTGNMAKDGKRIDFDMSLWIILFIFKITGPVDWAFRDPTGRFDVTAYDIEHSPNLRDALPFYWPTIPARILPEAFISLASQFFQVSRNAFLTRDNEVYKKLETHPVYIHYKYATFLKLALTKQEHYHNIGSLHIRSELTHNNAAINDLISTHMGDRIKKIHQELITIPSFRRFIEQNGDAVIKDIVFDFAAYNEKYQAKLEKQPLYQDQLVDLSQFINDYANICAEMGIPKNQDKIKQDPEIAELLAENIELRNEKLAFKA